MFRKRKNIVLLMGLFLMVGALGCSAVNRLLDNESVDPNTPTPTLTPGEEIDYTAQYIAGGLALLGVPGAAFAGKLWGKMKPGKALEEVVRGVEGVRNQAKEATLSKADIDQILAGAQSSSTEAIVSAIKE